MSFETIFRRGFALHLEKRRQRSPGYGGTAAVSRFVLSLAGDGDGRGDARAAGEARSSFLGAAAVRSARSRVDFREFGPEKEQLRRVIHPYHQDQDRTGRSVY